MEQKKLEVDFEGQVYTITKIANKVYHVKSLHFFDLGMLFLRATEYVESKIPFVKNKGFDLIKFIREYSIASDRGSFTYPRDWAGYNVSSDQIRSAIQIAMDNGRLNIYDVAMDRIVDAISEFDHDFYLIGSHSIPEYFDEVIIHELAHAFYFLDPDYKSSVTKLADLISSKNMNKIVESLNEYGYAETVHADEIQAYIISGISSICNVRLSSISKKYKVEFKKALKRNLI